MSARRILLIDSDPAFYRLLDEQLRRYGFQVESDPEGADALARAANAPPALLVIAVDEPDKLGYSLCNKAKKGPLAKVPVMLATATISADGFANHRKLKLHADEYLDKRALSSDELLGKIDNLIGLGELVEEQPISLDNDDDAVEVADEELILDEEASEDEFEPAPTAIGTPEMLTMDALLDAETDAAFAALTGLDDGPLGGAAEPVAVAATAESVAVEPPAAPASRSGEMAAAAPARDEGDAAPRALNAALDAAQRSMAERLGAGPAGSDVEPSTWREPPPRPPPALTKKRGSRGEAANARRGVVHAGEPAGHAADLADAADASAEPTTDVASAVEANDAAEQTVPVAAAMLASPPTAARDSSPRLEAPQRDSQRDLGGVVVATVGDVSGVGRRARSELDLGLDEVAERADREQSGVFDRRTMQRVADLERENFQLKAELGRTKSSSGEVAKTPIEREFFALREAMVAKDKELATLRDAMGLKERELTSERDRVRQLSHAKTNLENKNQELETRLLEESEKGSTADSTQRAAAAQLAALRQEIDSRAQAAVTAESARAAAERELAAERQARMAMVAKMEHTVGAERASLEEYYRTELATSRANAAQEAAAAVAAAVAEADQAHDRAMEKLAAAHRSALEERDAAHARRLAEHDERHAGELRKMSEARTAELAAAAEHASSGEQAIEQRWRDEIETLRRRHASDLERISAHHEAALGAASGERQHLADEIAALKAQHIGELELQRGEHAQQLKQIEEHQGRVLEAMRGEHELALRKAQGDGDSGLRSAQQAHQQELVALRLQYETAVAQEQQLLADRTRAHISAMDERTMAHELATAELVRERAEAVAAFETARREVVDLQRELETRTSQMLAVSQETAMLREQVQQAAEDGQRSTSELRSQHATALAKARSEAELAATKARIDGEAALAKAKQDAEAAVAKTRSEGEAALAKLRGEHAAALTRARAEAEAAMAKMRTELAEAQEAQNEAHQQALELESERRTAELRAMQEHAEQGSALLRQQHQQALEAAILERDELRAGLTSARDQLRKIEEELTRTRQDVGARDQELALHAQAVAERDQRIAELRGDLETMETESASYQEQVLKAYQKIKQEEARVAKAKKAVAIALTVLDDESGPGQ